jgi:hypothetical protein
MTLDNESAGFEEWWKEMRMKLYLVVTSYYKQYPWVLSCKQQNPSSKIKWKGDLLKEFLTSTLSKKCIWHCGFHIYLYIFIHKCNKISLFYETWKFVSILFHFLKMASCNSLGWFSILWMGYEEYLKNKKDYIKVIAMPCNF